MSNFKNPKIPPTGGSHLPRAHPSSLEMRRPVPLPLNHRVSVTSTTCAGRPSALWGALAL